MLTGYFAKSLSFEDSDRIKKEFSIQKQLAAEAFRIATANNDAERDCMINKRTFTASSGI